MTYSAGQLIDNDDYNGFVVNNTYNINTWWGPGSGNQGWGQTALTTVDEGSTVQASSWAGLVNSIQAAANHTGTAITARTAPASGDTVIAMSNVNTDITAIYNSRGNAVASGTVNAAWTGSAARTSSTGTGNDNWTLTWTNTVTFESADQARYFFNAGGLIRIQMNKSSTGTAKDSYWNSLIGSVGTIYISGGIGGSQTIGGVAYTGVSISGASGSYTYNSSAGWYYLLANGSTQIYQKYQTSGSYTGDYVTVMAEASATVLTITTTWYSPGIAGDNSISGGSNTASPFTSFGTAPAVVTAAVPPSSVYLTNTWGSTTIAESVTASTSPGPSPTVVYAIAGGGGGSTQGNGYGGGGGGGNVVTENFVQVSGQTYSVVVGSGGSGETSCQAGDQSNGTNTSFTGNAVSVLSSAGGRAPSSSNCGDGSAGGGTSGAGWFGGAGSGFGPADGGGGGAYGPGGSVTQTLGGITRVGPGTNYGGWGITRDVGYFGGGGTRLTTAQIGSEVTGAVWGGGVYGTPGTVNTGGGGGGGGLGSVPGAAGGSGVVIVVYRSDTPLATGGIVSTYSLGGYTYWQHTFNSSGNYVTLPSGTIATMLVVGGGGGGRGNGNPPGGGGGVVSIAVSSLISGQSYAVTVGAGGSADASGNPAGPGGTSSVAGIATSTGGIGGGTIAGQGGNSASIFYGTTTNYTGGTAWYVNNQNTGAGAGAGAGGNGETVPYGENRGGTGGIGYYASDFLIAGTDVTNTATTIGTPSGGYYGGGGGGGYPGADFGSFSNGLGGAGGGGGNPVKTNTGYPTYGQAGLTNTGGGGQGGSWPNGGSGGNGGSGIVLIRYAGAPIATGGTITQTGGYTYHVFTSSGTFTVT